MKRYNAGGGAKVVRATDNKLFVCLLNLCADKQTTY